MENNQDNIFSKEYDLGSETKIDRKKSYAEFSEEQIREKYEIGVETKSEEQKPTSPEHSSEPQIKVDTKKYGIGKPIRIILRGKLSHD